MEKMMEEEELKGLEEEIDNAVERLFVEKKSGGVKSSFSEQTVKPPALESIPKIPDLEPSIAPPVKAIIEPSIEAPLDASLSLEPLEPPIEFSLEPVIEPSVEPTFELPSESTRKPSMIEPAFIETTMEKTFPESSVKSFPIDSEFHEEVEKTHHLESPPTRTIVPVPFLKSIEKMEAQLLSLEWEINEEKLKNTREEVLSLRDLMKQKADIVSILNWMDAVLIHMIKNDENIHPDRIKFLLDAKETIKLLMKKETEGEIHIYKQLAYHGMEARFVCLGEIGKPPDFSPPRVAPEERGHEEIFLQMGREFKEVLDQMNFVSGKVDTLLGKMESYLSDLRPLTEQFSRLLEEKSSRVNFTVFKVDEKLFGVESQKVFKLFKVPNTFQEKYSNQAKVRLRDLEVEMIDLRKVLSIHGETPKDEIRILTVKDNGRVRGFLIDQVLKKCSTLSDQRRREGEYFSGVIYDTYQEQSVEIPILDLDRF